MSSERQIKSLWDTVLGRRKAPETEAPPLAPAAEREMQIHMPEEQRKVLEEAIPFHRPPDEARPAHDPQFMFGPLDPQGEACEAKAKERPAEVESFRKKYKKYGRDVCLPGEGGEPYDVLMDNSDKSHHGVNSVSPL